MPFTVCSKTLAPNSFILSCTSPAFSFSSIGKIACNKMLPVSIACCNLKVVTPVSFSPFITAQFIGAAPLYCGNKLPCTFIVPIVGILQTTSGNILKATTICKSACKLFNASINSGDFNLSGCKIGKLFSTAYFFTALCVTSIPRPAGLSGAVTTATILHPSCIKACKLATANSGVPINTIRKSVYFMLQMYCLAFCINKVKNINKVAIIFIQNQYTINTSFLSF